MPRYYSEDMKLAALRCVKQGKRRSEILQFFGISLRTLSNWVRAEREGVDLLPNKRTNYSNGNNLRDRLQLGITERSDSTLEELSLKFKRSQSTIHYHLAKLGITRKKNHAIFRKRRAKAQNI